MADYHVGCGITAIFAGTLNKKNGSWINKSDVTNEAFKAVAQYCLEHDEAMNFTYNGKRYRLCVVETKAESEDKHTEERTETHACDCKTHGRTHACDCISRQAVSDIIKTRLYQTALNNDEYITSYAKVCEDIAENRIDTWINEAKSVEPERKTGKWIENKWGEETCSECEYTHKAEGSNFCPNCGAKMEV